MARVLRSPLDTLGCALLPADCALCGSPLPRLSPVSICDACWTEFPEQTNPVCFRCGGVLTASEAAVSSPACRVCRLAPPAFVRAVSCGPYEGRMRDAIHALKYDGLLGAARPLGVMLAFAISRLAGTAPSDMMVIPVPLHRSKHAERGFNQARTLATHALAALRRTHPAWRLKLAPSTVLRLRATASQASLSPRQRRINVRGAFKVADPAQVQSKDILVIDDIFTTGATVLSVAQELRRAGAASVWVATLARARLYFGNRLEAAPVGSGRIVETEEIPVLPGDPPPDNKSSESMHLSRQQSF